MIRNLLLGALAAVVVVGGYIGSVYWRASSNPYAQIEQNGEAFMAAEYAKGIAQTAQEKADTYGGTTPQETWKLFVAALEAGDTDLAAKYFVVEKQEEMREFFKKEKDGETLNFITDEFKNIKTEKMYPNGKEFDLITTPDPDLNIPSVYSLHYVETSNLWKIYGGF